MIVYVLGPTAIGKTSLRHALRDAGSPDSVEFFEGTSAAALRGPQNLSWAGGQRPDLVIQIARGSVVPVRFDGDPRPDVVVIRPEMGSYAEIGSAWDRIARELHDLFPRLRRARNAVRTPDAEAR